MAYVRGIWLFGKAVNGTLLELILSKRFMSVENRVKKILGEDYVEIPNDKEILEWFTYSILFEKVSSLSAAELPQIFLNYSSHGVFSVDNLKICNEKGSLDKKALIKISESNLLQYMKINKGEGYVWPFMYSSRSGYFVLILLSLETSIGVDHELLNVYKKFSSSLHKVDDLSIKIVEVRMGLQLLEDLLDLLGLNQEEKVLQVCRILEVWRVFIPFGSPTMDKKEVKEFLSFSKDKGVPKSVNKPLSVNYSSAYEHSPSFSFKIDKNVAEVQENFIHGKFYPEYLNNFSQEEEQAITEIESLDFNDEIIPGIPGTPKNHISFGEVLNLGIGKLSNRSGIGTNHAISSHSIKFSLIETICCFAKKHPMITRIKERASSVGEESMDEFIKRVGEPYSGFTSGILEFSGKLPNSVSISCQLVLPWQRIFLDSIDESNKNNYIQPYISIQDNVSCSKVADELFDSKLNTYSTLECNTEVHSLYSDSEVPVSRYKISWNSSQTNSKILSYWYPYEMDVPIKGYFTIFPESKEPVKQISQSKGNFRPILIHSFQMEYCLCLDSSVIKGMQTCQISIPLLPGTLNSNNTTKNNGNNIPSLIIYNHDLKSSMGHINISRDKKTILWNINNPAEIFGKKSFNNKFPFIQVRLKGSIKLKILYKEKRNKLGTESSFLKEGTSSQNINSYPLNIGIKHGRPYYSQKNPEYCTKTLYSTPDPYGSGIQPILNCPIKDVDPIWMIELHPKIAEFSENTNKLTTKEIYMQLLELIFSYSIISFDICSNESTYKGVTIPNTSISINPKALKFDRPEVFSSSGKYIIWRNS
ncbi:hypothetical protein HWI79_1295 [Cryptosporidium felis]|nr:hypothetical protein HWI79_1295 [Cryptosporidium felis]